MAIETIQDAIDHIAETEEIYALEECEIRGVTYRTFKNGPKSLRDVHELCLKHGDADFLVYANERYSFNDVHRLTLKLAGMLVDVYGVKQGDSEQGCFTFSAAAKLPGSFEFHQQVTQKKHVHQ